MTTIAEINLSPGVIIVWLVVGLITGWLAARVLKGGGYGLVGDIIVGLIGAVIGGLLFGLLVTREAGVWGSMVAAISGAWVLLAMFRFLGFGRSGI
jgi:uncharacterized membrane protein YeaQ/YmgE (transglycosylase-associated protein family)